METMKKWLVAVTMAMAVVFSACSLSVAAPGDRLATIQVPVRSNIGVSVAADCQGRIYYNNLEDPRLFVIDKNGKLLNTLPLQDGNSQPHNFGELAWDSKRKVLWSAEYLTNPAKIYQINPQTGECTFKFVSQTFHGLVDGLAYDAEDDTLWISGDAVETIEHHKTDGTYIKQLVPQNQGGGVLGSISGVCVAKGDLLYLGQAGRAQIVRVNKKTGAFHSNFASPGGTRDEGLECDSVNFGKLVLLSKDAYDNFISVIELSPDTCSCGGGGEASSERPKIIMLKGTNNSTEYEVLKQRLIKNLGYDEKDILITNISENPPEGSPGHRRYKFRFFFGDGYVDQDVAERDGAASIENCVTFISQRIRNKKSDPNDGWGGLNKPIHVNIIAHSAGGLVARHFINLANHVNSDDRNSAPLVTVDNLITLGTPYGGIHGSEYGFTKLVVQGPILDNMNQNNAAGNPDYMPNKKIPGSLFPFRFEDTETIFGQEHRGTMFWGLGGTTPNNTSDSPKDNPAGGIPFEYALGIATESPFLDGFINVRSALGHKPRFSLVPSCQTHFRFLDVNHRTLPTNVNGEENAVKYILQVLNGVAPSNVGWQGCSNLPDVAGAEEDSEQLVEGRGLLLQQGQVQSFQIPVDSAQKAVFRFVTNANCKFTLKRPDGINITATTQDPSVQFQDQTDERGFHFISFSINNPLVGIWTIETNPTQVTADKDLADSQITVQNALALVGAAQKLEYPSGASPILLANLKRDTEPHVGATVTAHITGRSNQILNTPLFDDGKHNDGTANDGLYGNQLSPVNEGGVYNVTFKATGTNAAGQKFRRIANAFFTVAPKSATLGQNYKDHGVNNDADDTFESLGVDVPINVTEAGNFLVEGTLKDNQGNVIETTLAPARGLALGARTITLLFDGSTIFKHGKAGPFTITDVKLFADTTERPILITSSATGHQTVAYTRAQFDEAPVVRLIQPDASNPQADQFFDVVLNATDSDNPATFSVFYDTDKQGADGVAIALNLPANGDQVVNWNTSIVPDGHYFIYVVASDGIRPPVTIYSRGQVSVRVPPPTAQPTITAITPNSGFNNGSVRITITGSRFLPGATVKLVRNGQPDINGTNVVVQSTTQIAATFDLAGKSSGLRIVVIHTVSGDSPNVAGAGNTFTVIDAPPSITAVSPQFSAPGKQITITGTNFTGATAVKFNGLAAIFTVNSATQITATVPERAITGRISVTTPAGTTTSTADFIVAPWIGSFTSTPGGYKKPEVVTVTGANFTNATQAFIGNTPASFVVLSSTQIRLSVPVLTYGKIKVSSVAGTGTSEALFIGATALPKFDVTPLSGRAGIKVRLTGTSFAYVQEVRFNGVLSPSFKQISKYELEATVPAGTISGIRPVAVPVEVRQRSGTGYSNVSKVNFTVIP